MNESDQSSSSQRGIIIPFPSSSSSLPSFSSEATNDVTLTNENRDGVELDPDPTVEPESGSGEARLPTVFLDRDFHAVLDVAMKAMKENDPMVFVKGDRLIRVLRDGGAPRLLPLESPQLREVLSTCARWIKKGKRAHPPSSVATVLAKRGHWDSLRQIRALTVFPVLSSTGELRTEPGYDEATKTFHHATCEVLVPANPTRKDARSACDVLLDLVSDFPFASKEHQTAWVASVLAPLSRYMHDGNVPLTIIQANAAGSGKTSLAQIVALITTGSTIPVMSCEKGEPNRKELLSKLRASPPVAIIDNVLGRFGGANINALITSRSFEDRALGFLRTLSAQNDTAWFATGNRIVLAPDLARRCLHVRLKSLVEKPHERKDFRHTNLMQHVRDHRGELLSAALTILKAYAVAGFPEQRMDAWGSFEDFSRIVRGALRWCGLPDPAATRSELEAEAEEGRSEHERLVLAWEEAQTAMKRTQRGMEAKDALAFVAEHPEAAPLLRTYVAELRGEVNPGRLARNLRNAADRNFGGKMLGSTGNPKVALRWTVSPVPTS